MPAERFFAEVPFTVGETVVVEGLEFHHLRNVMRKEKGEGLELVNGKGQLAVAIIEKIGKHDARCNILSVQEKPSTARIILAQALPRLNRLETIIEKAVELGVLEFWLFPGELSEKTELSHNQLQRLHMIAVGAMKQCGRLDLPQIVLKPALAQWEATGMPSFFGDTAENAPWIKPVAGSALIFIGPESGFTDEEEATLKKLGAQGVKLHNNILRTDTAAIAALCLLQRM
jgi:16S rRNA (uracil1498-N3)-methyltransferase